MQLVAQDYAEILAALKAASETKGQERRGAARMDVQAQVFVQPLREGKMEKPFTCLTRDLSFKGIGLLQCRRSAQGSLFMVRLPRIESNPPLEMICTVMYCRELAEGLFNVGAEFNSVYERPKPSSPPTSSPKSSESEMNRIRQSILG